jgi:hypothetical protein
MSMSDGCRNGTFATACIRKQAVQRKGRELMPCPITNLHKRTTRPIQRIPIEQWALFKYLMDEYNYCPLMDGITRPL